MGKIDKEQALEMMRSGESDSKIGERFGTSRQAVNLLKKAFIRDGILAVNAKKRDKPIDQTQVMDETRENTPGSSPAPTLLTYPSFDQLTDWMIRIIKDAGETALLRNENKAISSRAEELTAANKKLKEELEQVNTQLLSIAENSRRYEEVIRNLGLPSLGAS
jgi:hypothetical protein